MTVFIGNLNNAVGDVNAFSFESNDIADVYITPLLGINNAANRHGGSHASGDDDKGLDAEEGGGARGN